MVFRFYFLGKTYLIFTAQFFIYMLCLWMLHNRVWIFSLTSIFSYNNIKRAVWNQFVTSDFQSKIHFLKTLNPICPVHTLSCIYLTIKVDGFIYLQISTVVGNSLKVEEAHPFFISWTIRVHPYNFFLYWSITMKHSQYVSILNPSCEIWKLFIFTNTWALLEVIILYWTCLS